jgi:hypothetical protein
LSVSSSAELKATPFTTAVAPYVGPIPPWKRTAPVAPSMLWKYGGVPIAVPPKTLPSYTAGEPMKPPTFGAGSTTWVLQRSAPVAGSSA